MMQLKEWINGSLNVNKWLMLAVKTGKGDLSDVSVVLNKGATINNEMCLFTKILWYNLIDDHNFLTINSKGALCKGPLWNVEKWTPFLMKNSKDFC